MRASTFVPALLVAATAVLGGVGTSAAVAAPAVSSGGGSDAFSVSPEANPPEPGSVDAKPGKAMGATAPVQMDPRTGMPKVGPARQDDPHIGIVATTPYCSGGLVYVTIRNDNEVAKQIQVVMRANGQARFFYTEIVPGQTIYAPFYGTYGNYQTDLNILYPQTGTYLHDETQQGHNACSLTPSVACNSADGTVDVTLRNTGTAFMTVRTIREAPLPLASWDDRPPGYDNGSVVRQVPVKSPGGSPVAYAISIKILGAQIDALHFAGTC